jgi:hypothetical protein
MAAHGRFSVDDVIGYFDEYSPESDSDESDSILNDAEFFLEDDFELIQNNELPEVLVLGSKADSSTAVSTTSSTSSSNTSSTPISSSLNASSSDLALESSSNSIETQVPSDIQAEYHLSSPNSLDTDKFGCLCNKKCYSFFEKDLLIKNQLDCLDMTTKELDLVIIAKIQALASNTQLTSSIKKLSHVRSKVHTTYYHYGQPVCREFFLKIHMIGKSRLVNLSKHLQENGLCVRQKKSGGRKSNTNSLSYDSTLHVRTFLFNYAEEHGIKLPGRIPGFHSFNITLLPSHMKKTTVYEAYRLAITEEDRVVGISTFKNLWKELLPFVVINKPATDLCWTCQKNNTLISK